MSNFSLNRLINEKQAGEGSNLPPRQYGDIRVPIVSGLKIIKAENFKGGTTYTIAWDDPDFPNIRIAQYNIFVSGIDGVIQPQGPYAAQKSPAVIRVTSRASAALVFTVQTQLTNGLTSAIGISPSVATEIRESATDILLGSVMQANFNTTGDQEIPILAFNYIIRRIVVTNASTSLTTAAGGIYPSASKGGTPLVAAAQVYTALTAPVKYLDLTLEAIVGTDTYALQTLYFSLTTPQGAPATADIYIFGDIL